MLKIKRYDEDALPDWANGDHPKRDSYFGYFETMEGKQWIILIEPTRIRLSCSDIKWDTLEIHVQTILTNEILELMDNGCSVEKGKSVLCERLVDGFGVNFDGIVLEWLFCCFTASAYRMQANL